MCPQMRLATELSYHISHQAPVPAYQVFLEPQYTILGHFCTSWSLIVHRPTSFAVSLHAYASMCQWRLSTKSSCLVHIQYSKVLNLNRSHLVISHLNCTTKNPQFTYLNQTTWILITLVFHLLILWQTRNKVIWSFPLLFHLKVTCIPKCAIQALGKCSAL